MCFLNSKEPDPSKRLGALNGMQELRTHPFFYNVDFLNIHKQTPPKPNPLDSPLSAPSTQENLTIESESSQEISKKTESNVINSNAINQSTSKATDFRWFKFSFLFK